ncbi:MAG TPA: hypothetical protein PKG52_03390 [bacterium]|nr:hypothetical protein [bacterium]HPS29602.1 hypothetical protein [bacterium]
MTNRFLYTTAILILLFHLQLSAEDDFETGTEFDDESEFAEEEKPVEKTEPVKEDKKTEKTEAVEKKKSVWWCAGTCDLDTKKNPDDKLYIYRWNDGNAGLWLGGYVQGRYTGINDDSSLPSGSTNDAFALQKARLSFNGKLAKWSGFKIEFNIWDTVTYEVSPEEIYVDFPLIEYIGVRAGLIKSPAMYQRAMSGSNQLFADEAMVVSQKTTQMKGYDAKKKLGNFPSKDIGFMFYGDLFPWPHLSAMKNWPKGILKYYFAYQNGYDMKKGSGRGDASMFTLRMEANPFGYQPYNESSWEIDKPYMTVGFNWGKSVDLEVQDHKKDAGMIGVDGIMAWQGVSISGGWYILRSYYSKSFEKEMNKKGESYDSSWQSEGFFVQAAAFVPFAFWRIDLRKHLELKFRFEEFDPFKPIGDNIYTAAMLEEFVPVGINTHQDRKTRVMTFGTNIYFDAAGWRNKIKISFDYSMRDELENFRDINDLDSNGLGKLKNIQLRNDMWILQLQLAL